MNNFSKKIVALVLILNIAFYYSYFVFILQDRQRANIVDSSLVRLYYSRALEFIENNSRKSKA